MGNLNSTTISTENQSVPTGSPTLGLSQPYLPPLTDKHVFTFVNKSICDEIVPYVFSVIVKWGCAKDPVESFQDFIKSRLQPNEWNKFLKVWTKDDRTKLLSTDCVDFDVTFLCKLIPYVCDRIENVGTASWTSNDENKIECLLKRAKDARNKVMHDPKNTAMSCQISDEIIETSFKIIEVAAKLYKKSDDEAGAEKTKINHMFREIKSAMMTDKQKRLSQIRLKVLTDGLQTIREKLSKVIEKRALHLTQNEMNPHGSFYSLSLTTNNEEHSEISCKSFFEIIENYDSPTSRVIILEGPPGCGKSTLLKKFFRDFLKLSDSSEIFVGIGKFELALIMECRVHTLKNFRDLLMQTFGLSLANIEMDDILWALQSMKILFLIDGIDELNSNSRQVIEELLEFVKSNPLALCIASSRPRASALFKDFLKKQSMESSTFKIMDLQTMQQQIEFLSGYLSFLSDVDKNKVLDVYNVLDLDISNPLQLVFYCSFFLKYPDKVTTWTCDTQIMRDTLNSYESDVVDRLRLNRVSNAEIKARKLLTAVHETSFHCLQNDELFVKQSEYLKLKEKCFDNISKEIEYDQIFSSILKPDFSSNEDEINYDYFHKNHQEYMAAKFLIQKLEENPEANIVNILTSELKRSIEEIDLIKYLNVLKFVFSELYFAGRLLKHAYVLCSVLQRAKIDYTFCLDLISYCNYDDSVTEMLPDVMQREEEWNLASSRSIRAASKLLKLKQPEKSIRVSTSQMTFDHVSELAQTIHDHFEGQLQVYLRSSEENFIPSDKIVELLHNAKCKLVGFTGHVRTPEAVAALASISENAMLRISLLPLLPSNLYLLKDKFFKLSVTVNYSSVDTEGNSNLPSSKGGFPPCLRILNIPAEGKICTLNLILSLAPTGKRFSGLHLVRCFLQDEELDDLLDTLEANKCSLSSSTSGTYKWIKD